MGLQVAVGERVAGLERPAWDTAGLDPARAAATAEYLGRWLPTPATLGRYKALRWSRPGLVRLTSALVLRARALARLGRLGEAVAALECAAEIPSGTEEFVALERATLLLHALHDPAAAREALKPARLHAERLPSEREGRPERLLRLAAVEEALAAGDRAAAKRLADALAADEAETPSTDEGDMGASFPAVVRAAQARAGS